MRRRRYDQAGDLLFVPCGRLGQQFLQALRHFLFQSGSGLLQDAQIQQIGFTAVEKFGSIVPRFGERPTRERDRPDSDNYEIRPVCATGYQSHAGN